MDSDKENRVLYYQVQSHGDGFDHQMMEDDKENREMDEDSSDEVEKMSKKPFLSYLEIHEGESKIKINEASDSGSGHMRSHPERDWRGMKYEPFPFSFTPTYNTLASSSAEEHKNHDNNNHNGSSSSILEESSPSPVPVDLSSSCSGGSWLKKDKRGRQIIGEAEAAEIAAHTLMYIHLYGNYDPLRHCFPPREPIPEEAALLRVKKSKEDLMINVGGSSSSPGGKQKEKLDDSDGNEEFEWDMKVVSLIKEKKISKKKRKLGQEMIKSEEGEPLMIRTLTQQEVNPSKSYVCNVCDKSFPCFQALGGHKTKHNREKNMAKSTKVKEVVEQRGEEDKGCINGALLSSS